MGSYVGVCSKQRSRVPGISWVVSLHQHSQRWRQVGCYSHHHSWTNIKILNEYDSKKKYVSGETKKRFHDHWLPLSDEDEEGVWRHYETGEVKSLSCFRKRQRDKKMKRQKIKEKMGRKRQKNVGTGDLRHIFCCGNAGSKRGLGWKLCIYWPQSGHPPELGLNNEYLDINDHNKVAAFTDWGPGQPNGRAVQNCACLRKFNGYRYDFISTIFCQSSRYLEKTISKTCQTLTFRWDDCGCTTYSWPSICKRLTGMPIIRLFLCHLLVV